MQLNLLENVYMNVFMQYYININKPLYIVVPPERAIIRRERDAGAYRLSAYYIAKITSELPLTLCAPLIFFSILYWMVGIGDATLWVIYVAVNLEFCLIVQVSILSFYLTLFYFNSILVMAVSFIGGENRSQQPNCCKSLITFSYKVVSSTPRYGRKSNSQSLKFQVIL
jgi:ABC-type multidrug transport system permease subunit